MSPDQLDILRDPAFDDYIELIQGKSKVVVRTGGRKRVVEPRDARPFEDDLLERATKPAQLRQGRGASIPLKGKWIHGWLESEEEDYINSIYKNWLFFVTYLEARTRQFINVETYKRSPGSYESMYRYILILEELGLVDRFKQETVSQDEYNHFVPDNMRTRTFVEITESYEDNPDAWDFPHNMLYPDGERSEEHVDTDVVEEPEPDVDDEEPTPSLDDYDDRDEDDVERTGVDVTPMDETLGEREDVDPDAIEHDVDSPDEPTHITDFPDLDQLEETIEAYFIQTLDESFEESPMFTDDLDRDNFKLYRIALFGDWIIGEGTPGESELGIYVGIDGNDADRRPGFIPSGLGMDMGANMEDDEVFSDWFSEYNTQSAYSSAFTDQLRDIIEVVQDQMVYYDLQQREYKEL